MQVHNLRGRPITGVGGAVLDFARSQVDHVTPRGQLITRVVGALKVVKMEKVVTLGHTMPLLLLGHCVPMSGSVQ